MNFYKHYLGDYARKTAHLSLCEHGAYRKMLDHYYATGRPLPADLDALCRICGAISSQERQAVSKVADEFFPANGDGTRHNARADEELHDYSKQAATNRKTAQEREAKRKEHESLNEQATNDQPKPEVRSQKLEVIDQKPETSGKALSGDARLILAFLNEKTGRDYRPVPGNLDFIIARLREGVTLDDLRAVIAKKCREWTGDEKMATYLRPKTLFNRTNFAQYQGELHREVS